MQYTLSLSSDRVISPPVRPHRSILDQSRVRSGLEAESTEVARSISPRIPYVRMLNTPAKQSTPGSGRSALL